MIPFLIGEWAEWRERLQRKSLATAVAVTTLISVASFFDPVLLWIGLGLLSLALGWRLGNRYPPHSAAREVLLRGDLGVPALLLGKLLSALGIWVTHVFFLSPALVLALILRSLPLPTELALAAVCLVAFVLALAAGFASGLAFGRSEGLPGLALLILWLLGGAFPPFLRPLHPLLALWEILRGEAGLGAFAGLAALLLLALGLLALGGLVLARRRRDYAH